MCCTINLRHFLLLPAVFSVIFYEKYYISAQCNLKLPCAHIYNTELHKNTNTERGGQHFIYIRHRGTKKAVPLSDKVTARNCRYRAAPCQILRSQFWQSNNLQTSHHHFVNVTQAPKDEYQQFGRTAKMRYCITERLIFHYLS